MAKNNMLLGMARGSVGDVTFYRREGIQVARARNRSPKNPQSSNQAGQRMRLSPITAFYSQFREPIARSWQERTRAQSYNDFVSVNMKTFDGPYVPKGSGFVPWTFQVSRGSMAPVAYKMVNPAIGTNNAFILNLLSNTDNWGDMSQQLFDGYGAQNGDFLTFLFVIYNSVEDTYIPYWTQGTIDTASQSAISDVLDLKYNIEATETSAGVGTGVEFYIDDENNQIVAGCAILSRNEDGVWKRSTQRMVVDESLLAAFGNVAAQEIARKSYEKYVSEATGDVYLDGGGSEDEITTRSVSLADGSSAEMVGFGVTISEEGTRARTLIDRDNNQYLIRSEAPTSRSYKKYVSAAGEWSIDEGTSDTSKIAIFTTEEEWTALKNFRTKVAPGTPLPTTLIYTE